MLPKITIQTDADFTPKGKRRARIVKTTQGKQLRWYVGGRHWRKLQITNDNIKLTHDWLGL